MSPKHRRVFQRSFDMLEILLFSNRYGFSRPDLSILDISTDSLVLTKELQRIGYKVQRLDSGLPLHEPLDLVVCNGPLKEGVDLHELLKTFKPGFQVILMNQPIQRNGQSDPSYFNPSDIGKYRLYPIGRWYDLIYGYSTMFRLKDCPVVKIKPIG
jgi:hypothetical protein